MSKTGASSFSRQSWTPLLLRIGLFALFVSAILLIWLSNLYFTERFTQTTRSDAERQLSLYSGRISSELQRISVVPLLLSRDTTFINDLNTNDFTNASQRLIFYQEEIGSALIMMMDIGGRVVASSDRRILGQVKKESGLFVDTLRGSETVFSVQEKENGGSGYYYSRRIVSDQKTVGLIAVEVSLDHLFDRWSGSNATIIVTDSEGIILLSTERQFQNKTIVEALATPAPATTVERALRATGEWNPTVADAYIRGRPLFRLDSKLQFQGWRLAYLATFDNVRARVNGVLALEIMGFAILVALVFFALSRRAIRQTFLFKAESEELRTLNDQLSREIAERQRIERDLQVAEQSLAQSSKLAALGEMSAAVSHELNQPLAAMRTYLAGAKLLLNRQRPVEALSSFQRIDDLITRMGSITKQLKSYARKGGEDLIEVDFRTAVQSSLSMMSPQLSQMKVDITTSLPKTPVIVLADPVRLEQVIINLFRNALDAMKGRDDKQLDVLLVGGEMAQLSVRDNGEGIENLDDLFEPFYTTKKPGEGVGLGLAISSGIAKDLGGRLLARNATPNGAVFEFQLPQTGKDKKRAAE